jgi:hypothetical protein
MFISTAFYPVNLQWTPGTQSLLRSGRKPRMTRLFKLKFLNAYYALFDILNMDPRPTLQILTDYRIGGNLVMMYNDDKQARS